MGKSVSAEPLTDGFGRVHTSLRVSVTDRCNIRCFYCMPVENVEFRPRHELLTFEEIERFVQVPGSLGIDRLRITGGEPLLRVNLSRLIERLVRLPGLEEVSLTTNGMRLGEQAQELRDAGLDRLNISLDSLDPERFQQIARRPGLDRVLAGIAAARQVGFEHIKLNAVAIRGLTEPDIVPLGRFARQHGLELRFIEFMPLDAERHWNNNQVLSGEQIRAVLEAEFGPFIPAKRTDLSQPATDYLYHDGRGRVGFINPVSQPFCQNCNRLRITAEGQVRNCLFSSQEWDARAALRGNASDEQLRELIRSSVAAKLAGHGINSQEFHRPRRAMFQIGG